LCTASEKPDLVFHDSVQVHEVVAAALHALHDAFAAKNIQVTNQIPADLPRLNVDKPKFHRLFQLLLKDEIVSLPPGSQVTIGGRLDPNGDGRQPVVEVQVHDNGPGLPQEALRLIFDPFMVRSDSPMEYGINLIACYFIVHHHGGRIDARSDPGGGTTFTLRFFPDPTQSPPHDEQEFLKKLLVNDALLDKLLISE
jgi:two-component system probable response regulator PhcQ